ncbi:MAG: bifunctional adenosylcobinamide kinase/adenosylcobinamide-phosphate guanylyltransferase [Candidatus Dormibacteria bacterium]
MLTLVLGGVKSGKSSFGMGLAAAYKSSVIVCAPGKSTDPEMEARIARHKRDRPADWIVVETIEEWKAAHIRESDIVLIDSIDTVVFTLLEAAGGASLQGTPFDTDQLVDQCVDTVFQPIGSSRTQVIAISNEVGLGILPGTFYGRLFCDVHGCVNQKLAKRAHAVHFMIAGIPTCIKKSPDEEGLVNFLEHHD